MIKYNKLVRDKMIQVIENDGRKAKYKILSKKAYFKALKRKLEEEVIEVKKALKNENMSEIAEEIADVREVLDAIAKYYGITKQVEEKQIEKRNERGSFDERVFLKKADEIRK